MTKKEIGIMNLYFTSNHNCKMCVLDDWCPEQNRLLTTLSYVLCSVPLVLFADNRHPWWNIFSSQCYLMYCDSIGSFPAIVVYPCTCRWQMSMTKKRENLRWCLCSQDIQTWRLGQRDMVRNLHALQEELIEFFNKIICYGLKHMLNHLARNLFNPFMPGD